MSPRIPPLYPGPECLHDVRAPLVYVTFGTILNRDLALFRRILDALESLPVEVVATVGENNDRAALDRCCTRPRRGMPCSDSTNSAECTASVDDVIGAGSFAANVERRAGVAAPAPADARG